MITVIQAKNIKKTKKICHACGFNFGRYRGHTWITCLGRGKYLCRECEKKSFINADEQEATQHVKNN